LVLILFQQIFLSKISIANHDVLNCKVIIFTEKIIYINNSSLNIILWVYIGCLDDEITLL